jgi:AhpD family alkylhydroperoxidase
MARIDYPDLEDSALEPLVSRIKRERDGRLLSLYRMLLHSPPVAEGWLALFTAVRQHTTLPNRCRELVTLRVAAINRAAYQFAAHVSYARKAGVTEAEISALEAGREPAGLSAAEHAVIAYVDAMTRSVQVPDAVFANLRPHFDERQIVELTAVIGGYNLVSRFLEALQVDREAEEHREAE